MAQLYEYAVWMDEKRDKDGEIVEPADILVKPLVVVAQSEEQVGLIAAKSISDEHMQKVDRIKVAIRPF